MRLQSLNGKVPAADLRACSKASPDQIRGNSNSRGYTYKWRKAREHYLRHHPLCVECFKDGRAVEAIELDHITPHKGDMTVFWDKSNWQGLCHQHHSAKTVKEDGGFCNPQK